MQKTNFANVVDIYSKEFKIPFLIHIWFLIEDRMPDMEEHKRKYKVHMRINFLTKYTFSYVVRSPSVGVIIINGKEIL